MTSSCALHSEPDCVMRHVTTHYSTVSPRLPCNKVRVKMSESSQAKPTFKFAVEGIKKYRESTMCAFFFFFRLRRLHPLLISMIRDNKCINPYIYIYNWRHTTRCATERTRCREKDKLEKTAC